MPFWCTVDCYAKLKGYCEDKISTTLLRQWGFRQCLPFSWTKLRDKHCQHPIAVMGVVDMFGPSPSNEYKGRVTTTAQKSVNLQYNTLGCLDDWTNESCTKRLMFQVLFFFRNFLQNSLQKSFQEF